MTVTDRLTGLASSAAIKVPVKAATRLLEPAAEDDLTITQRGRNPHQTNVPSAAALPV